MTGECPSGAEEPTKQVNSSKLSVKRVLAIAWTASSGFGSETRGPQEEGRWDGQNLSLAPSGGLRDADWCDGYLEPRTECVSGDDVICVRLVLFCLVSCNAMLSWLVVLKTR